MASYRTRKNKDGTTAVSVEVRRKGFPAQRMTFTGSGAKTKAKVWAAHIESDIQAGRAGNLHARNHTLNEAIARYRKTELKQKKSAKNQGRLLDWWSEQIGNSMLSDINARLIAEYRDKLSENREPATVMGYLAILSHVFSVASREWEWIETNPVIRVSKPKLPKGRVRVLTDDERERLLSACWSSSNNYLHTIVFLALSTGMRKNEILTLTWKNVFLDKNQIILEDTKNGERRNIPLFGQVLEYIKTIKALSTTDLLFPGRDKSKPIAIDQAWVKALRAAEIENFVFHDLRHTYATYALESGASPVVLARLLGHKTLDMVQRYAHVRDDHAAEVVKTMNERYLSCSQVKSN